MRLGLIVNPIAGMGGAVGLKGTDDVAAAIARGAEPVAHDRAVRFLRALRHDHTFYTAGGTMGDDACADADVSAIVLHTPADPTTAEDTRQAAAALAEAGVDVVVFVGGDGTAADVAAGLDRAAPMLGVPSGVKMYSAAFAATPERAAVVVESFDHVADAEVLDIDEPAFRAGELKVELKAVARVPAHRAVQSGKLAGGDDAVEQESLGDAAADVVRGVDGTWVLGAGTTMQRVKAALGVDGTLLGVDAARVDGGKVTPLAGDATEADLLALPDPVRILVSPIGAQGFILGRGNLQISARVVRRAGVEGVNVAATPTKLLDTPSLHVDTGDPDLDGSFPRFLKVVTGHHTTKLMRVE